MVINNYIGIGANDWPILLIYARVRLRGMESGVGNKVVSELESMAGNGPAGTGATGRQPPGKLSSSSADGVESGHQIYKIKRLGVPIYLM